MIIGKQGDVVNIHTRRLENVTAQFPEVAQLVRENVKAESCMIDGEAVGYDPKTKKYVPFQNISQRIRRKYEIEKMSEDFPVELNVFDIQNNAKLDAIETYTSKLDDLTYDASSNLNVNIASGSLTVDSVKIKASNGDNLTATTLITGKSGLDTASNIFGFDGSTRTAITCDSGGKMNVRSHNTDYLGNGITSTTTSISGTATNSLDTSSSLYVSNGNARTALTATGSSLNANITNTVPISGSISNSFTSCSNKYRKRIYHIKK
jgi:hypothetical protein